MINDCIYDKIYQTLPYAFSISIEKEVIKSQISLINIFITLDMDFYIYIQFRKLSTYVINLDIKIDENKY